MNSGVYEIVCVPTGKRYVGSAVHFKNRWRAHRGHLNRGSHHSPHLQSAWRKHGEHAFVFRQLIVCDKERAVMYEQIAIDAFAPEFNVAQVAGSALGTKRTDEQRARISRSKLGNQATLGLRFSDESRAKLSAALMGRKAHNKGQSRSPEAIAKTATAHRGMKRSKETCRRISEAAKHRVLPTRTESHRAALSAALIGKRMNQDSIDRMAATKRGSTLTVEHKGRISEGLRAAWARRKAAKKDTAP